MEEKETLRLIGSYRENGLLGKRKVYIKNEEKVPLDRFIDWEKYGYTDIDENTGLVWATVAVSHSTPIAYVLYAVIFVVMLLFYSTVGLIFYAISGQLDKHFFSKVWEEVNDQVSFSDLKPETYTNDGRETVPVNFTEKEMKKYFTRKSFNYAKKRFSGDTDFTDNTHLNFTSSLLYVGRLEGEWKFLDEYIVALKKKEKEEREYEGI